MSNLLTKYICITAYQICNGCTSSGRTIVVVVVVVVIIIIIVIVAMMTTMMMVMLRLSPVILNVKIAP